MNNSPLDNTIRQLQWSLDTFPIITLDQFVIPASWRPREHCIYTTYRSTEVETHQCNAHRVPLLFFAFFFFFQGSALLTRHPKVHRPLRYPQAVFHLDAAFSLFDPSASIRWISPRPTFNPSSRTSIADGGRPPTTLARQPTNEMLLKRSKQRNPFHRFFWSFKPPCSLPKSRKVPQPLAWRHPPFRLPQSAVHFYTSVHFANGRNPPRPPLGC